jgi:hypothetical protein
VGLNIHEKRDLLTYMTYFVKFVQNLDGKIQDLMPDHFLKVCSLYQSTKIWTFRLENKKYIKPWSQNEQKVFDPNGPL